MPKALLETSGGSITSEQFETGRRGQREEETEEGKEAESGRAKKVYVMAWKVEDEEGADVEQVMYASSRDGCVRSSSLCLAQGAVCPVGTASRSAALQGRLCFTLL